MSAGAGYSRTWLGGSSNVDGFRELLLEQQGHRCAECDAALDGFLFWALPLADGRTVGVCSECGGKARRLLRQTQGGRF